MTCEDCLYKGFCENQYGDTDYFDDETIYDDVESLCGKFKDKSLFVELPAALGTNVWCVANECAGCKWCDLPDKESLSEYIGKCQGCTRFVIIECELDYELIPEIGKMAFLTKEAAEKRLEELRNG